MVTYRVGNHQPQNVYRDDAYIGVMFTAEDAALVVEALNEVERVHGPALPVRVDFAAVCGWPAGVACTCGEHGVPEPPADSCTCATTRDGRGVDPACPVHQGRRARGPKPPPLGAGCICDGSGRTCPRHGAVM